MLNVPKEVVRLFGQSGVKKNFRVSFPKGEHPDLVNKDFVADSACFTERICSRNSLVFGLCEASVLEFTANLTENIKGYELEAGIEIDISSLEEEFIAQYGQTSNDVAFPYYYVPYGRFEVESCKKQNDFNIRKVVAYDAIKSSTLDSYIGEQINNEIQSTEPFRAPSIYQFEKNFFNEYGITQRARQRETVTWSENLSGEGALHFDEGNTYVYAHMYDFSAHLTEQDYYTFSFPSSLNNGRANELKSYIETQDISFGDTNGFANWLESLCTLIIHEGDGDSKWVTEAVTDEFTNINTATLHVVDVVEIRRGTDSSYAVLQRFDFGYQDAQNATGVYKLRLSDIEKRRITTEVAKTTARSLLSALYELKGTFGRINREDGYIEDVALGNGSLYPSDTLYPANDLYPSGSQVAYRRSNYGTLTYEEYETKPFNSIYASYRDENGNDSEITYTFADAGQTYKMTNNWILKNLNLTRAEVEEILVRMAEKIKNITFVPFDMSAIGLPYLETGDMIEIATKTGTIRSYIMTREISGIQLLEDSIDANGKE